MEKCWITTETHQANNNRKRKFIWTFDITSTDRLNDKVWLSDRKGINGLCNYCKRDKIDQRREHETCIISNWFQSIKVTIIINFDCTARLTFKCHQNGDHMKTITLGNPHDHFRKWRKICRTKKLLIIWENQFLKSASMILSRFFADVFALCCDSKTKLMWRNEIYCDSVQHFGLKHKVIFGASSIFLQQNYLTIVSAFDRMKTWIFFANVQCPIWTWTANFIRYGIWSLCKHLLEWLMYGNGNGNEKCIPCHTTSQ